MTTLNSYITLDAFKSYITASGQSMGPDTTDDAVIDIILDGASRWIDGETRRHFYPTVETRYYGVPEDSRQLDFDEDLLEMTTLTNGDGNEVSSTDYNYLPRNEYPRFGVKLTIASDLYWEWDSDGNSEDVISALGFWGYHNQYSTNAWKTATTAAEALDDSETGVDVASFANLDEGMIIKIDTELMLVTDATTTTITVERGHNGSTAAAHDDSSVIYYWKPQADIWLAAMEIANNAYHRRFGTNITGATGIAPGGVVIAPTDVTEMARNTIKRYIR